MGRNARSEMVFDMDSSTEEKWSRLVILKMVRSGLVGQALVFTDKKQVGLLVNAFARCLRDQRNRRIRKLLVED